MVPADARGDIASVSRAQLWLRWARAAVAAAMVWAGLPWVAAQTAAVDPSATGTALQRALPSRLAARSLMLALAGCGTRLVSVGERGRVLLSDDQGRSWRQARSVPAAVTLTAVQCVGTTRGWAVGHAGVVLRTDDAGESWTLQLEGVAAARLALDAALAKPADAAARRAADQLVADGPDKPFLALRFSSSTDGLVLGAYGLLFSTQDGGTTWQSRMSDAENPEGLHLNAVRTIGAQTYIAGEKGLLLRSDDGKRFVALKSPYEGSWFAIDEAPGGGVVLAGLRGNVFLSSDRATSWRKLSLPSPASVTAILALSGDKLLLIAQDGAAYLLGADGKAARVPLPPTAPLTAGVRTSDDAVVMATFRGPVRLPMSASALGMAVSR